MPYIDVVCKRMAVLWVRGKIDFDRILIILKKLLTKWGHDINVMTDEEWISYFHSTFIINYND